MKVPVIALAALLALGTTAAQAQYAAANAEWNRPLAPFRVAGNLYYVGAVSVSAYLVATPEGLILIDSGFRETAAQVEANIARLGFQLKDVKLLLTSHAHYDHAGGVAELKAKTKARLLVNPAERRQFERGGKGDFALKDTMPFPPVKPDGDLRDGEAVRLGGAALTPIFTPGHTRGCTSWALEVNEGGRTLHAVIPCSLSAPDYQLVNNREYPGILADYEASIRRLRATPCDVFLPLHGWDNGLEEKAAALRQGRNEFLDPAAFRAWLDKAEANLKALVEQQRRR